tara:strand:+ start:4450 stop:5358 length:909 start_codon:yes stop_codon:yes gene_type:complete
MNVLVAGGSGMVGHNLISHLSNKPYKIFFPSSSKVNLLDKSKIDQYIKKNKIDVVIHCAGLVGGISMNIANQAQFLNKNTLMGLNLINSSFENGVSKFINLGSSCMYPRNLEKNLSIDDLLTSKFEPTNEGYAISKILIWKYLKFLTNNNFLGKTIIPCNLYGPNDNFDLNTAHLIPAAIAKAHNSRTSGEKIEIWGTGSARREFMYVEDLTDFIGFFLDNFNSMPDECNLGTEHDFTVKEYYENVCHTVGIEQEFIFLKNKPEGMKRKKLDISFQKSINWIPKNSLQMGLKKTYEYFKTNI